MSEQHAGKLEGNGVLQKIILGIASALCILLIGLFMQQGQRQQDWMERKAIDDREIAERLARVETKIDMVLATRQ